MDKKAKTARLSIISNTFLIIIKLFAGLVSGSVSVISEAIHSAMDLVAALIAYFSFKIPDKPADKEHPYGHGRFENVSGVIEAVLIFIAAIWIILEAIKRIVHHDPVEAIHWGLIVMVISAVVNFFVSHRLYKVAKETGSIAIEADALHLKTDFYTSVGVAIGLLIIWFTGITMLDPIVAILVALLIIKESFTILRNAYSPLPGISLANDEIARIEKILNKHELHYHVLKTRKAGQFRFVDIHLKMPEIMTLKEVHDICDRVEAEMKKALKNLDINIHVEPQEE